MCEGFFGSSRLNTNARKSFHGRQFCQLLAFHAASAVNTTTPSHLRLHTEDLPDRSRPRLDDLSAIDRLCRAFQDATGWQMALVSNDVRRSNGHQQPEIAIPIEPDQAPSPGRLSLTRADGGSSGETATPVDRDVAEHLAGALANVLAETHRARHVVWQREAELATGIPLVAVADDELHVAHRLEQVLKGGAEAVGCQAAALYLLDDATSRLKLRAGWGLPKERFLEDARPLRGAVADLEALTGHAVVLEDTTLLPHWKVPEPFPAAACVPVSTSTVPLGTLWLFAESRRDFTEQQTNVMEIVAGRLAADLEREILLRDGIATKRFQGQLSEATRVQRNQLPQVPPLLDDWEVAGWTGPGDRLGGDFFNWFILRDGSLAVAAGGALGDPLPASLTASAVQAALHSQRDQSPRASRLLGSINRTLWAGSAGDQFASLFYGIVQPESGRMVFSTAGRMGAFILRPHGWDPIAEVSVPIGTQPDTVYQQRRQLIAAGDVLLVISDMAEYDATGVDDGRQLGQAALAERLLRHTHLSAQEMIDQVRRYFAKSCEPGQPEYSVLVVKRRK